MRDAAKRDRDESHFFSFHYNEDSWREDSIPDRLTSRVRREESVLIRARVSVVPLHGLVSLGSSYLIHNSRYSGSVTSARYFRRYEELRR